MEKNGNAQKHERESEPKCDVTDILQYVFHMVIRSVFRMCLLQKPLRAKRGSSEWDWRLNWPPTHGTAGTGLAKKGDPIQASRSTPVRRLTVSSCAVLSWWDAMALG